MENEHEALGRRLARGLKFTERPSLAHRIAAWAARPRLSWLDLCVGLPLSIMAYRGGGWLYVVPVAIAAAMISKRTEDKVLGKRR